MFFLEKHIKVFGVGARFRERKTDKGECGRKQVKNKHIFIRFVHI